MSFSWVLVWHYGWEFQKSPACGLWRSSVSTSPFGLSPAPEVFIQWIRGGTGPSSLISQVWISRAAFSPCLFSAIHVQSKTSEVGSTHAFSIQQRNSSKQNSSALLGFLPCAVVELGCSPHSSASVSPGRVAREALLKQWSWALTWHCAQESGCHERNQVCYADEVFWFHLFIFPKVILAKLNSLPVLLFHYYSSPCN